MTFAQMTHRESLRDLETCLRSLRTTQFLLGLRSKISRSTLADANEKRDYRIFAEFGQLLMKQVQILHSEDGFGVDIEEVAYAFDSTNIDLCLSLFPWAQFDPERAGLRVTTSLALDGNIPCFMGISTMAESELAGMDMLPIEAGALYIFDRGFFDWTRLYKFPANGAYFLIRAKADLKFKRRRSLPINKIIGIRADQIITPFSSRAQRNYPGALRRISFLDLETQRKFVFLTNNLSYAPEIVASLYKSRWKVELFFKWIKQHLRIKSFYGTSPNAIKTQIWSAIITYLLLALAKKTFNLKPSLYTISQTLTLRACDKNPLIHAFQDYESENNAESSALTQFQPNLFDVLTGQ